MVVALLDLNNVGGQKARRFLWSGSWRLTRGPRACLSKDSPRPEEGLHADRAASSEESCWGLARPVHAVSRSPSLPALAMRRASGTSPWQRRGQPPRGACWPGSSRESAAPCWIAWLALPLCVGSPPITSIHLAGHVAPAAGGCVFVSRSACCWH